MQSPFDCIFSASRKRSLRIAGLLLGLSALSAGVALPVYAQPSLPAKALSDQSDYDSTLKQARVLEKTDPAAAVELLQKFAGNHPTLDPGVRVTLLSDAANITFDSVKDKDRALTIANQSLGEAKTAVDAGASDFLILRASLVKARILMDMGQTEAAQGLLSDNWEKYGALIEAPDAWTRSYGDSAFRLLMSSYARAKQPQVAVEKLESWMRANPSVVVTNRANVLKFMVDNLVSAGKPKEALSWARVSFMMADFDNKDIESSTRLLAKSWVADKNLDALRDFTAAQSGEGDAKAKNPLQEVELPPLIKEAAIQQGLRAQATLWSKAGWQRAGDMIGAYLLTGQEGLAMERAHALWSNNPQGKTGTQEIGRVFKAVDLDTTRGNRFVSFVAGTTGSADPVAAFMVEHPASKTAG